MSLVNSIVINTRAHDALLFTTVRPNSEKYKNNVLYKGAILWNARSPTLRNIESYVNLKSLLKDEALRQTVPQLL